MEPTAKRWKYISKNMSLVKRAVNELHSPERRRFSRRKTIIKSLQDLFQIDLVEMIPYAKENDIFKYIFVCINTFSKYVWAIPLKPKTQIFSLIAPELVRVSSWKKSETGLRILLPKTDVIPKTVLLDQVCQVK